MLNDFKSPSDILDFDSLTECVYQSSFVTGSREPPSPVPLAAPAVAGVANMASRELEGPHPSQMNGGDLHVCNAGFDYVPPHLVSLLVTDTGGHNPSYVYRLLSEYYSAHDYTLTSEESLL